MCASEGRHEAAIAPPSSSQRCISVSTVVSGWWCAERVTALGPSRASRSVRGEVLTLSKRRCCMLPTPEWTMSGLSHHGI
jgi:hypothetical protein